MRIKIKGEDIKNLLFNSIKDILNKSWKEIREDYSVSKKCFDDYKSGKILMPEKLFYQLIKNLDNNLKDKIINNIEKFPDNFGQIKGGKKAYLINFEKFEEGRQKANIATKLLSLKEIKKEIDSFSSIELSDSLCELAGAFIGDGRFNKYNNKLYHIEFAGDRRYDLSYYHGTIIPILKIIVPDLKPHIYKSFNKENAIRIVFYSRRLFYFLKEFYNFIPGRKAHTIFIPEKITLSKDENIRSTIRGIFDTDGGVFLDKRKSYNSYYPRIYIQTVSERLYNQLCDYLSKHFKVFHAFDSKRQIYKIEIYGIHQLRKWMSIIGFSNKRHLDKVNICLSSSDGLERDIGI